MSKTITGWEDTANGILAFACNIKTATNKEDMLLPLTCWK